MKQLKIIVVVLLALLGAAAGVAKMLQTPQELAFFQQLGLGGMVVVGFGLVQLAGAVLLVPSRTRLAGALVSDLTFTLSAVMIFMSGAIGFGVVALVPVVLVSLVIVDELRQKLPQQQ